MASLSTRQGQPIGMDSPGVPELADYSTQDHEFTPGPARMLTITSTGGGQVTIGTIAGKPDVTFPVPSGQHHYPYIATHVRNSGTTAGMTIIGLL